MKRHLKTLDKANINAPLLREFLAKDLHSAAIISIDEKMKQLQGQIRTLLDIKDDIQQEEIKWLKENSKKE